MKVQEFCQSLEKLLAAEPDAEKRMQLISAALQKAFRVGGDEVALLKVAREAGELVFVWPKRLARSGSIPLSSRDALAVRTARERVPLLDNRFAGTRHASVFERIYLGDQKVREKTPPLPIQKIMSVPVMDGDQLPAVLQLCRKGPDPDGAGPDFTVPELNALAAIAAAIARHFPLDG